MGWTEDQFLDTSWPYIRRAQEGRDEMLRAIFGGGEPAKPESKKPEMNPALFDRLFGGKKK